MTTLVANSPLDVKPFAACASLHQWGKLSIRITRHSPVKTPFDRMRKLSNHELRLSKPDHPDSEDIDGDGEVAVQEEKPRLKRPPMYKVVMLNDDYTPMEFVVEVLEIFFAMGREQATRTMLQVHTQGKAVCGVFTRDIAETKAAQVNQYARENQHPLLCEIEGSEDDDS